MVLCSLTFIMWLYPFLGFSVDESKGMLGTFAPQKEPYVYALNEETTPSGALARGIYSAKLKVCQSETLVHFHALFMISVHYIFY